MLVSIRPGYSAASCYIVTGLGPLESLYNLCLRLFAQVTREAAFCHIDGPRSIRESLHACVHSPRWRQRSAIICESPCILVFIHPGHSGAAFSNITTGLDPLENLCMLVFIRPGYLGAGTLRRALSTRESLYRCVHSCVWVCCSSRPTVESFVASLTLARDLLMHHRQPETKDKRFILVGKPSGNDIPTLE